MRRLCILVALGACGAPKASGPAWPAPSTTAEDGGESLEPRSANSVAAAIERSAEPEPAKPAAAVEDAKASAAAETADKPATPSAPIESSSDDDDLLMSDEIIIEIED